ncbi:kinesin motor catalytic domain protein (macronuclear) [Tetrahymena thermophila SB210]|uniref:Kinesin motor catalytic domain protein n=1 Tax=Tetrahymena thermophila (strain SB210) TaxID=312017 RepID=I7LW13_TETTS|nr:kinesin motor catalytic domain protein [Tetrahymena thermophila SB210]EAS00562.2 kinesin motor catalytic domain protein [Tetrahymena thermophila SB210]|eukprot:XP_001020807.2 kinesin motor catalytic domain protein [Tetrahymena thermophila SB210]
MENIQVALRIRPINQQEVENNDFEVWSTLANDEVGISAEKYTDLIRMRKIAPGQKTSYLFNKCFDQRSQNTEIYEQIVKRIALSSLKGINGTVFMYGQTGSGKTFTMLGQNREDILTYKNSNTQQQQIQNGRNSSKLIGDPLSPKNMITKDPSSRLSRQQSSSNNLVNYQKGNSYQQQQHTQQQYGSKSSPKQRDSASLNNNNKENQDISGYLNQFGVQNTLRYTNQINEKGGYSNYTGIGAFRNSVFTFSPINQRENINNKKNSNQQSTAGASYRSQNVTPDKYLTNNSQKSQAVILNSQNTHEVFQDSQGFNQKSNLDGTSFFSQTLSSSNQYGILILSLIDIFKEIQNSPNNQFLLRCSYVEIYTDFVYDLLKPFDKLTETLQIGEDYNKEFFIKGAVEEIVSSIDEILQLLKYGEYNRHYTSTAMNHVSSRSHTIFRLYVRAMPKDLTNGNQGITESILNFVDLAGSEKISIHHTNSKSSNNLIAGNNSNVNSQLKERQIESKTINKSLFFLTQVISLKSQGKQESHIPYRNSPLTKILRSSLGGNSRTAIILCLNPCLSQLEQSASTLRFGLNAKKIENQVKQNVIQLQNNDILQSMIKEYETRIVELESEKNVSKVNSENLVKMIQTLIEQKNNLEKTIKAKELFDKQQNVQIQGILGKKKRSIHQDFIHLDNVGLIKIAFEEINEGIQDKPNSFRDISKEIHGNKCAMRKLKNLTEQKKMLEEQVQSLKYQVQHKTSESSYLVQRLEKKLASKKRKLQTMKANKITLGIENSRLKQELALYRNQNIEGLKKLSVSKLEKLEKNVEILLKNVRNQMSALAIKREFEGDPQILQRINKTLQLKELMDCELLELANDFFEPNLQLNTSICDEDDSFINLNDNNNFQYHNIHSSALVQDNNDFIDQQKFMKTQGFEAKNKYISESPFVYGISPRDTVSCQSYKADEQYQFTNSTQNQFNIQNQASQTSLNNFQATQKCVSNKLSSFNMQGVSQDSQIQNILANQNFGSFQNYFNQVVNCQKQRQQVSNYQLAKDIAIDSNYL